MLGGVGGESVTDGGGGRHGYGHSGGVVVSHETDVGGFDKRIRRNKRVVVAWKSLESIIV